MTASEILKAMRADCIPEGESGRWTVRREVITDKRVATMARLVLAGKIEKCPQVGTYTHLWCLTDATMHRPPGECVMNDFDYELRKHLQFIMVARGRVLVTGLGLGCVVRGLLARGRIDSIDLVERSRDVIKLCGASVSDPRVRIHEMDAMKKLPPGKFDCAWHDIWSDPVKKEPALQLLHFKLMAKLRKRVPIQGAWDMPRRFTRRLPEFRLGG